MNEIYFLYDAVAGKLRCYCSQHGIVGVYTGEVQVSELKLIQFRNSHSVP